MKKILLVAALALSSTGCCSWFCTPRHLVTGVSFESYDSALQQIRGNVAAIRTDVSALTYDADIKEADLQLLDATIQLCDDTLAGKNAAPAEGSQ